MSTLDRYLGERDEQTARGERELQIEESPELEEILKAHKEWTAKISTAAFSSLNAYHLAASLISGIDYSASDVLNFTLHLKEFEEDNHFYSYGLFISALINEGSDDAYTLKIGHLETELLYIGYRLGDKGEEKSITVDGNVGSYAGEYMSKGSLIIYGNSNYNLGKNMSGGSILLKGNAGPWTGDNMCGGRLEVEGNASEFAGKNMLRGDLIIKGDAKHDAGRDMRGGTLTIHGDSEGDLGTFQIGGDIYVRGDVHGCVGEFMKGGTQKIRGDVGDKSCFGMKGGTLHVKGDAGSMFGFAMEGGTALVEGKIRNISRCFETGTISESGRIKRPTLLRRGLRWLKGERS